jgi:type II secretory pathway predicted ATPase ExeA
MAVLSLIQQQRYFVLHAPRQTGKTTCLLALQNYLNASSEYVAIYINVEPAQAARENIGRGMRAILSALRRQSTTVLGVDYLSENLDTLANSPEDSLIGGLSLLARKCAKPIVLFLDEVDSLVGDTLISLLRQIRAGYTDRPGNFPLSIVLCGVRDVRDYRMTMADGEVITGGSAFNIKAESLRLGDFVKADVAQLYQQHTALTGQVFTPEAIDLAWESTQGQPWLVNALAEQAVWKSNKHLDRSVPVSGLDMREAREALILRNDTHLDQLADKLREPRVRSVIEPILIGNRAEFDDIDTQYVLDLGLIRRAAATKSYAPANGIYAEILPRVLSRTTQMAIDTQDIRPSWQNAAGKMQPKQFLLNFLDFWREHGEPMMRTVQYHEAAPHLVLMAYLQRVVNGEGRIEREYAAGSGRLDLLVVHDEVRMAIEVKVWAQGRKDPLPEGLVQIERYLHRLNVSAGFLVIFDRRSDLPAWEDRMRVQDAVTQSGKPIMVLWA